MADRKISDLTALTTPATGDLIPIVDISEAAAADKNKSITVGELLRGAPDGTAAAPGIAFESDGGNGMFLGGTDILAFSTGGTQAVTIDASQRLGIGTSSFTPKFAVNNSVNGGAYGDPSSYYAAVENAGVYGLTTINSGSLTASKAQAGVAGIGRVNASGTPGADNEVYGVLGVASNSYGGGVNAFGVGCIGNGYFSGSVGIGTTSPGSYSAAGDNLVISDSGNCGITIASGTSSNGQIFFADGTSGADTIRGIIGYTHSNNDLFFGTNAVERARIDSSGRLLVGTSTARNNFNDSGIESKIQIEGAGNDDSAALTIIANSGTTSSDKRTGLLVLGRTRGTTIGSNTAVVQDDAVGMIEFKGSDGTNFTTAATIRAQVDGSIGTDDMPGRLVFSTTADGASSPTERVRISNGGRFGVFSADNNGGADISVSFGAGTANRIIRGRHSATGTYTGTTSFEVLSNGNVNNTNNSYGALSDIKLKENIVNASSQWDDLKSIQVRNYNFKEGQTHTQIGVVAQEVELVSPGLVTESPDIDEDGNDLGTTTKSVNYSVLYMKAVKALQEAMERIETLEAEVAALKGA